MDDAVLYKQVNEIHDRFVNTEKLKECHHGFSSQKTESMNKFISMVCPKRPDILSIPIAVFENMLGCRGW
jgi:hypothetical protein